MMLSGVIFDRQEFKVLQSIVVLDPVSVVDVLALKKVAAKVRRHDDAVLQLEIVALSDGDISVRSDKPSGVLSALSADH